MKSKSDLTGFVNVGPAPTAVAMVTGPGGNMRIHLGSAMCSELAWWRVRGSEWENSCASLHPGNASGGQTDASLRLMSSPQSR